MVVRQLVTSVLRNAAMRRVQEAVVDSVPGPNPAADGDEGPDAIVRYDVGVVCAMPEELGGLLDRMTSTTRIKGAIFRFHGGMLGERPVVVVASGPGRSKAAAATSALISGHHPTWVISAGFSGALQPQLDRYDLIFADGVANEAGERLTIDLQMRPAANQHVGRLLTVDALVDTPAEKQQLGQRHGALAVDMESYAVAETCRQHQTRFMAIRIVSDLMDEQLPGAIQHILHQETAAGRWGAVAGSVWRHPGSAKTLWRLRENALVASDRLADFLVGLMGQFPAK